MKKYNLLLSAIIITCLLSCKKGGSSSDNNSTSYVVSTLAGGNNIGLAPDGTGSGAGFNFPTRITHDASGNLYTTEEFSRIRKITPAGVVTTIAGSNTGGYLDGPGSSALFSHPTGIAVDASNNIYVADNGNHRIRKITQGGMVSTLAGNGRLGYVSGNGQNAGFDLMFDLVIDAAGNLYVSGFNGITKITPAGAVSTFVSGGVNGMDIDKGGTIYAVHGYEIDKISPAGVVSTLAGSYPDYDNGKGDIDGPGTIARFASPTDVAVDASGNVYVTEIFDFKIRKITPAGLVSTFAGSIKGYKDGDVKTALFEGCNSLTIDGADNIYIADSNAARIRKIVKQ